MVRDLKTQERKPLLSTVSQQIAQDAPGNTTHFNRQIDKTIFMSSGPSGVHSVDVVVISQLASEAHGYIL